MRRTLTYANVTATLALVLAMSGGAIAASHYLINSTSQIKPSVLAQLRGKPGPPGTPSQAYALPIGLPPVEVVGPKGAEGQAGVPGQRGEEGERGKEGGEIFRAHVCNALAETTLDLQVVDTELAKTIGGLRAKQGPPVGPTGIVTGAEAEIIRLETELHGKEAVKAALDQTRAQSNC